MKILFADLHDATSLGNWSGTPFRMVEELRRAGVCVSLASPLSSRWELPLKGLQAGVGVLSQQRYRRSREPLLLKSYARAVEHAFRSTNSDFVLAPSTLPVAYLSPDTPYAIWHDATWVQLNGYYPIASEWSPRSQRTAVDCDARAWSNARVCLLASDWAANSVRNDLRVPKDRVSVVPFGASVHPAPSARQVVLPSSGSLRMLAVGVDWERKNFAGLAEVVSELIRRGIDATLDIAGANPPLSWRSPAGGRVRIHGPLPGLDSPDGLRQLFDSAHIFVHAAQAECFGLVLAEAAAFALPTVALATGGVPSIVLHGETGILVADSTASAYADAISRLVGQPELFAEMSVQSRRRFEETLNWQSAASTVIQALDRLSG